MVLIRPAVRQDLLAIADLMDDLDRFYGGVDRGSRAERLNGIEEALFAESASVYALLAWGQSAIAGMAAYSFLWPAAGVSRSLYLKELYVVEQMRRAGVGGALMTEIFRVAKSHRCSRVEWATEVGNIDAQQFYATLGATQLDGKVSYRVVFSDH